MSYYFNQRIRLYTQSGLELHTSKITLSIEANDISDINWKSGMVAAASSISIMALVGNAILPLIGFAALPFLRKKMLNKRLNEAKEQVIPEIKMQITKIIIQLNNEINKYIDNQCEMICTNTEYAYNQILINMKQDVYKQLEEKRKIGEQIQIEFKQIESMLEDIKRIKEELL